MDLRQLRYFTAIAREGSLTAAARYLRIAQPALSQHVLALERELGARLLERGPRGVRLTESGKTLLQHALVVLQDIERAREAISDSRGAVAGHVAIGLPTTVATFLGVPLLRAAFTEYPQLTVRLVESHSGFLHEWLEAGRLDLAILFNVTDAERLDLTPLIVDELYLISSADAALHGNEIRFVDLSQLDLLMSSQPHGLRRQLDDTAFLVCGKAARVKAEINALTTLKSMVEAGLGHTLLPLAAVRRELAAGTLVARRIINPVIERHAALVSSSRRPQTRAQRAMVDIVRDVCGQVIADGVWPGVPKPHVHLRQAPCLKPSSRPGRKLEPA
ncbi:LysR family transcriptional regulator, nitrogen assimilation regulatory protein [Enhydrobacter aerosaccus]|uniref:LysR family transcriptional regulator, nitrogen assimilation regulatory protein n=1 Tax=Enhydrobacter aerosaccus TaxID=225324 RepID=A0A1T4KPD7_9HYPH|nr:LysR substrate-binding domain-containing protein [Enhydrobacter aerosaccus]SJZ44261.1 LysR family transcriptional regulator, nitrogen assimilation regulatory protein [Enhydrobacter aerosaccus]